MDRLNVSLKKELSKKLKIIGKQRGMSVAELMRQGAEHIIHIYLTFPKKIEKFALPKPKSLGKIKTHHSEFREIANEK